VNCPYCAGQALKVIKCKYGTSELVKKNFTCLQSREKYQETYCNGKYTTCEVYRQMEQELKESKRKYLELGVI
jgi:transcriptional regulator NrdR family protein